MNALLQSLFALKSFRQGVFDWRDSDSGGVNTICAELQRLFVSLQTTIRKHIDPAALVAALRLDTGVQQDAQEFQKLFLAHIEERFKRCPAVATLIPGHFQGEYSYVTTCTACGKTSCSRNTFTELELNIEKHTTVEECLAAYVAEEELTGANKYFCEGCGSKQDARRRIAIERLPQVLNLQLLRFQFDLATLAKRKLQTSISFPYTLDMRPFVSDTRDAAAL